MKKDFDLLTVVDDQIRREYPALNIIHAGVVYLMHGWTHANAQEWCYEDWIRFSAHCVKIGNMDAQDVMAILKQCTPCNCKRCVEYLTRQS